MTSAKSLIWFLGLLLVLTIIAMIVRAYLL